MDTLDTCIKILSPGRPLTTNWSQTSQSRCRRSCCQLTRVVDQDDLVQDLRRRPVDDAVERPLQRLPVLVVERDDDADTRQLGPILLTFAPGEGISHLK